RTVLPTPTDPQIPTTPRPRTASPSSPLNRPSLQTLAVARPRPNPHSKHAGTAQYVPFLAVSSLGGFQTPAAVRVGMFVTAGVWKPSHFLTFSSRPRDVCLSPKTRRERRRGEDAHLQSSREASATPRSASETA